MASSAIELKIDGTAVKPPLVKGMSRKPEPVWSSNTGRTGTAKMQGTIIAIKTTLSVSWPPLTYEEEELIESLISNKAKPFHTLAWKTPSGAQKEMECYFGTPSFDDWDWINGEWMCVNAKVDAIER